MYALNKFFVFFKCVITLLLLRSYGNIIYDLAQTYQGKVSLPDFRNYEKLTIKKRKAELDVAFLKDCQSLGVFPKFLCFPLPNVDNRDTYSIRKRLLRSNITKRCKELRKLEKDLAKKTEELKNHLSSIDWYILNKALTKNVDKQLNKILSTHRKKLKKLTKNKALPFTHKDTVTNLSKVKLSDEELDILRNGLNFSIRPSRLNSSDILTTFERIHLTLKSKLTQQEDYAHLKTELGHLAHTYISSYRPTPNDLKKHRILRSIRNNDNIIVLKPDKGNGVVIMDRQVYINSCYDIINNPTKFKLLSDDPTIAREARLQRLLRKLKKGSHINDQMYQDIFPRGSQPARLYGLPKLHKLRNPNDTPPLRPIVSSINSYNYNLAKYLSSLLSPLIPNNHSAKDSFTFIDDFLSFNTNAPLDKFFISYDVESLFTNIPLNETIDIAIDLIFANNPTFTINRKDLKQLFNIATAQTHFLFDGKYYDQTDGVAMGSPLAPILANIFMGFHEQNWINDYDNAKPLFYRRYVDDIFCVFRDENDAMLFFDYINKQHNNITFTYETEHDNKLPFLDVLLTKSHDACVTSTYHKPTYTGLLLNFFSFTPLSYKTGLIRTLVDRARKLNNTENGFQQDLKNLIFTLQRNAFPFHFINNTIQRYLDNNKDADDTNSATNTNCEQQTSNRRYFKLPYIGDFSRHTQRKLTQLVKRYCTDIDIKLVFTPYKIKNLFCFKDSIPDLSKSMVVYQFSCAGCNSRYIGETSRQLATRVKEHTTTDKNSNIYKHLHTSPSCKNLLSQSCFKIIDSANSTFSLKIKEALHINKLNPDLNVQIHHFNTIFSL